MFWRGSLLVCLTGMLFAPGCRAQPRHAHATTLPTSLPVTVGLEGPQYVDVIDSTVAVPAGWAAQPVKRSSRHAHQTWLAPTGKTAYGVIHFSLPFPVGYEPVLWFFMREMKRNQGEAELLSRQWDPNLRGIRFVAQGGLYTIRTNLMLRGFSGWVVYAGTRTDDAVISGELDLAERAREHTMVGRGAAAPSTKPSTTTTTTTTTTGGSSAAPRAPRGRTGW